MISSLLQAVGVSTAVIVGINAAGYAFSTATRSHKVTDLSGVGAFVVATSSTFAVYVRQALQRAVQAGVAKTQYEAFFMLTRQPPFWFSSIAVGLVSLWGIRLASFLFSRILQTGHDDRLNQFYPRVNKNADAATLSKKGFFSDWFQPPSYFPVKLAGFWSLQAIWAMVTLLPVSNMLQQSFANLSLNSYNIVTPKPWLLAGAGISAVVALASFMLERAADNTKYSFKQQHPEKFCDVGVYKWSRFPNYAGEIGFWSSMYSFSQFATRAVTGSWLPAYTAVSPIFVYLLLRYVSGVPLLLRKQDKRYGQQADYQTYKRNTNLLFPWFPKSKL